MFCLQSIFILSSRNTEIFRQKQKHHQCLLSNIKERLYEIIIGRLLIRGDYEVWNGEISKRGIFVNLFDDIKTPSLENLQFLGYYSQYTLVVKVPNALETL